MVGYLLTLMPSTLKQKLETYLAESLLTIFSCFILYDQSILLCPSAWTPSLCVNNPDSLAIPLHSRHIHAAGNLQCCFLCVQLTSFRQLCPALILVLFPAGWFCSQQGLVYELLKREMAVACGLTVILFFQIQWMCEGRTQAHMSPRETRHRATAASMLKLGNRKTARS